MNRQLPTLDQLGLKFGTDKSSREHDYLSFYELFFERIRHENIKLLEVGVLFGASLRLWGEYFPKGTIVGADIDPSVKSHSRPRILTEIIDQSNIEELVHLGVKHGPFDIIIEDGSHLWEHQITTLKTLFPFLKNGGYYIAEDLHTNFGTLADQYQGSSSLSFVEYSKKLLELRVGDDQVAISNEEDPFLRTYGRNIEFVTYYRRACLLRKNYKANPHRVLGETPGAESSDVSDRPLIEELSGDGNRPLSIVCHIGMIGNRQSSSGALTLLREDISIQGFTIYSDDSLTDDLEYRARLADGTWTEWQHCNAFVGTTGRSMDLTGFSARLSKRAQSSYSMELAGQFRRETTTVKVEGGKDCVGAGGANQLYGMQITIRPKG